MKIGSRILLMPLIENRNAQPIIIHIHDTIDVPHPRDTKDILTWPT